ncbi:MULTISPECIES: hypothetical protein [Neobacillus]|uniref:Uncharacterized protein n=1 Tax=Neobacillus rhizophilus TaxID=2833579 RepID=A0A942U165_9BACI|nr:MULTISPECIES: hypothetical protein [Neobacillus]MBS4212661.1 hypothetical protein [Neobacillus rhizophilus]MBU8915069.1 hypothetical protein [Bacillus sp. FJAT-29953]
MSENQIRFEKEKVILIASGTVDESKRYFEQQNRQFKQNTRIIMDTITSLNKSKKRGLI